MNRVRLSRRCLVLLTTLLLFSCSDNQTRGEEQPMASSIQEESFTPEEIGTEQGGDRSARETLLSLLGGYEQGPPEDALRALGIEEEVVGLLLEIWMDESIHRHRRLQALLGLRFFPDDGRTIETFEAILEDREGDRSARRRVVRVYGELRGEEGIDLLAKLLTHDDEHTQIAAIEALQAIGSPQAMQVLCAVEIECGDQGEIR